MKPKEIEIVMFADRIFGSVTGMTDHIFHDRIFGSVTGDCLTTLISHCISSFFEREHENSHQRSHTCKKFSIDTCMGKL